jgi:phosphate-selective porin OprO and OprP
MTKLLLTLLFTLLLTTSAQKRSDREQKLEKTVELLEQRIQRLENLLINKNVVEHNTDAEKKEDLNKRLAKIEQFMDHESKPNNFDVYWKKGLKFKTKDGKVKFNLGGRIYHDSSIGSIDNGEYDNGTTLRRVRLHLKGSFDEFFYKTQYDFSEAGLAEFKDVFIGFNGFQNFTVMAGQFKEPFSLAELTSSKYQTIMEDPTTEALAPGRNSGLQLNHTTDDQRLTWEVGIFHIADDFGNGLEEDGEAGDLSVTGRVSYLLWNKDKGRDLFHIGAAYSYRQYGGDEIEIEGKGSYDTGDDLISSGTFNANTSHLFGLEAAWVNGPFSLQGEYVYNIIDSHVFHAYYVQASYFLTGEHRPYEEGQFQRVTPNNNFKVNEKGMGAVELAMRIGGLDLSDSPVTNTGNESLTDYAFGVNWYFNSNTRLMLNYVYTDSDSNTGDAKALFARVQIDF